MPKIEVFRHAAHPEPLCRGDDQLIAFVTDTAFDLDVPAFGLNDVAQLADLIEKRFSDARQPSTEHPDVPRPTDNPG
jgi:molybdopterin-guanine dinucleotide biosynthesis protein B